MLTGCLDGPLLELKNFKKNFERSIANIIHFNKYDVKPNDQKRSKIIGITSQSFTANDLRIHDGILSSSGAQLHFMSFSLVIRQSEIRMLGTETVLIVCCGQLTIHSKVQKYR